MANLPDATLRPAIFLDRDGVLNEDDEGYTFEVTKLRVIAGVAGALKQLKSRGYLLIVVSNQSGVARGLYTRRDVEAFHKALDERLRSEQGAGIDAFYYCPFHPDGTVPAYAVASPLRKPEPGMLLQAARELGVDLAKSYLVGDRYDDVECAVRAGVRGIQVQAAGQRPHPAAIAQVGSLADVPPLIPAP